MVFETLFVDLINRYLGSYIEALDASQLKIGLLGGNAHLENIDVKANAFDDLNLPVKVLRGHIAIKYDRNAELKYLKEAKDKELSAIFDAQIQKTDLQQEGFVEKLAANIIKNIQIEIRDVHIRYEDVHSIPGNAFSLGVTLSSLLFKFVDVNSLSFYFNHSTNKFTEKYREELWATDRMMIQNKYRKYRPDFSQSSKAKLWWKFATTAILEERIRRRNRMWSWSYIHQHRKQSRKYIDLWFDKLKSNGKLSVVQQNAIEECERTLDVFNIVLCRQKAEVKHKQLKASSQSSQTGSGILSWFGFGLAKQSAASQRSDDESSSSSSTSSSSSNQLVQRLKSEMSSEEEKARLFAAIDYSTEGAPSAFPVTYVSGIVKLTLNRFALRLTDDSLKSDPDVVFMSVNELSAELSQRSGDKAMSLRLRLNSFEIFGPSPPDSSQYAACLVTSQVASSIPVTKETSAVSKVTSSSSQQCLLAVDFDKRPLDRKADQRLRLVAGALQIVYDAETINKVVYFFRPPQQIRLNELSSTVLSQLEDVKEVTVSGLRHLASRREYTEVMIDVRPSYFLLPDMGRFQDHCRLLLVDLGCLSVRSHQPTTPTLASPTADTTGASKAKFDELKQDAYEQYTINLEAIQVIFADKDTNWLELRARDDSTSHILRPMALNFTLKRCLLRNDVNLPKFVIDGCLPSLSIDLADHVLISLFGLISTVPFPEADPKLTASESADQILKDAILLPSSHHDNSTFRLARKLEAKASYSTLSSTSLVTEECGEEEDKSEAGGEDLEEEEEEASTDRDDDDDDSLLDSTTSTTETGVESRRHRRRTAASQRTARELARDTAAKRLIQSNLIDLRLKFRLLKIRVKLLKRRRADRSTSDEDSVIVKLSVDNVGAELIKRRASQQLEAHLGSLAIAVPQFSLANDRPVCILSTAAAASQKRHHGNHDDERLLHLTLTVADKNAPDLTSRFRNTRHALNCQVKTLELCLHQEAFLLLIDFGQTSIPLILDSLGKSSPTAGSPDPSTTTTTPLASINARDLVESRVARKHERRDLRLSAIVEAEKKGQKLLVREAGMIQWLVSACVEKVRLTLCSSHSDLLTTTMDGLRIDAQETYSQIQASIMLSGISLIDRVAATSYRKLLWVDPGASIIAFQLTQFTEGTKAYASDPNKVDLALSLGIGRLHAVFLYHFVSRVLDFMNAFQIAIQAGISKVNKLSEAAVHQVQQAVQDENQKRISLNIDVQAPVIYMPQHSFSTKALMLDLGKISLSNHFIYLQSTDPVDSLPVKCRGPLPARGLMLEKTKIRLEKLQLSSSVLVKDSGNFTSDNAFVLPINFEVDMYRSLHVGPDSPVPLVDVRANLKAINISLCQADYRLLQEVLQDNLAEQTSSLSGQPGGGRRVSERVRPTTAANLAPTDQASTSTALLPGKKMSTAAVRRRSTLRRGSSTEVRVPQGLAAAFNFFMDSVNIDLFQGDQCQELGRRNQLATFKLAQFGVKGEISVDSSINVLAYLKDVKLVDSRPGSDHQITRVLDRLDPLQTDVNLLSVAFEQDVKRDQKIKIDLQSIHLCASTDYLLTLANFHLESCPQSTTDKTKQGKPNFKPITESGKRKRQTEPVLRRAGHRRTLADESAVVADGGNPPPMDHNLEVSVHLGGPEIVLIEDASDPASNSIKMTIVCPTELSFTASQEPASKMQGTIFMQTFYVNINPSTLQLIGSIVSSIQTKPPPTTNVIASDSPTSQQSESSSDATSLLPTTDTFWQPVSIYDLDIPYLDTLEVDLLPEAVGVGSDVTKIMEQLEENSSEKSQKDIISVRFRTIRVILESQIGNRFMPMLVLESSIDGELINPQSSLSIDLTVDLSLSYYNDSLNQWEPLIETLPDENDRMWSLHMKLVTNDLSESFAEEDWDEIAMLQVAKQSLMLISHDNLELTVSKTALDLLSNLGKSFESAYKQQQYIGSRWQSSSTGTAGQSTSAPYRIQNRTGWSLLVQLDPEQLQPSALHRLDRQFLSSLIGIVQSPTGDGNLGHKPVSGSSSSQPIPRGTSDADGWMTYLVGPGQELGLTETSQSSDESALRSTIRSNTTASSTGSRPVIRFCWAHPSGGGGKLKGQPLPLHRTGTCLLQLARRTSHDPSSSSPKSDSRSSKQGWCQLTVTSSAAADVFVDDELVTTYPVVADISTYLGMKIVNLRSTVELINDTSHPLGIYSLMRPPLPSASSTASSTSSNKVGLVEALEPNEIYALPIDIVNSFLATGLFIGSPSGVGCDPSSSQAFYWPERASASSSQHNELVYLAPLAASTNQSTSQPITSLQPLSSSLSASSSEEGNASRRQFNWPVQLVPGFFTISTLAHGVFEAVAKSRGLADSTSTSSSTLPLPAVIGGGRTRVENDFQLVIRRPVVLHNLLPISVNCSVPPQFSSQVSPGDRCTLHSVYPATAKLDLWFEYESRVFRGKIEVSEQSEELSVVNCESREGYELITLHLGMRIASSIGQMTLSIYAPYWLINKTGKDLFYRCPKDLLSFGKAGDDSQLSHPATFQGVFLSGWVETSLFGKRKSQPITYQTSSEEEESDTDDNNNRSQQQIVNSLAGQFEVISGTTDVPKGDRVSVNEEKKVEDSQRRRPRFSLSSSRSKSSVSLVTRRKNKTQWNANNRKRRPAKLSRKQKINLRVCDSSWSDKFSLDTVGSSGRVVCSTKSGFSYEVGVQINLSSSGLTKIVTFLPYFVIVNKSSINLECCEVAPASDTASTMSTNAAYNQSSDWLSIKAGQASPFWPKASQSRLMLLQCRVDQRLLTAPFPYYESHSILMKLKSGYPGVAVEVETTEEATVITLQLYQDSSVPVRLINQLNDNRAVYYQQRGVDEVHQISATMSVLYAWDSSLAQRELLFYCNESDRKQSSDLTTDCVEEFVVDGVKIYWVSFLFNLQRVLLFTEDINVARNARLSTDLEKIDNELLISIQSIGLSLVDNYERSEVAYLSITSSGIRWNQVKRGLRLVALPASASTLIEQAYAERVDRLRTGDQDSVGGNDQPIQLVDGSKTYEVDFGQMRLTVPGKCDLRRSFDPGVYLQVKTSPNQIQLHCKIFRVQIDNQRMDCTFPVVLAPFPLPKSVSNGAGLKPLVEFSAIISQTQRSGSYRFKYFRVLLQEMQCKLDQGFLVNFVDFLSASITHTSEADAFERDLKLINIRLVESAVIVSHLQEGAPSVFDNLHISPIKMHLSFSLTGSSTAFPSEVLNLFLKSLGVVLTDVQGVIFELAYFDRQACIMTMAQMTSELTRHYVSQAVRQMYVLVLGLDVLGNPFGVLRGIAQGVEDLFYEPVKGAVLGPEEFAEGVAFGVKSLFGYTVGGVSGAVSRITGTIGKGVAALTLDEEYQRRRREQMSRKPDTFGAGIAQGGRGLVMGVVHGVTGVVTKPIEGAQKKGVEGFFKGMGQGLVGVLTRPISGVVDFASSSFDGIRRLAETSSYVGRVRPPRYLRLDGIIRPYVRREAEGHLILRQVSVKHNFGHYLYHIPATTSSGRIRDNRVLILTSSELLIAESGDILGNWSSGWTANLTTLAGLPTVNRTGLSISINDEGKKKKRLLGGSSSSTSTHTRLFECNPEAAKLMVREIELAQTLLKQQQHHDIRSPQSMLALNRDDEDGR